MGCPKAAYRIIENTHTNRAIQNNSCPLPPSENTIQEQACSRCSAAVPMPFYPQYCRCSVHHFSTNHPESKSVWIQLILSSQVVANLTTMHTLASSHPGSVCPVLLCISPISHKSGLSFLWSLWGEKQLMLLPFYITSYWLNSSCVLPRRSRITYLLTKEARTDETYASILYKTILSISYLGVSPFLLGRYTLYSMNT